MSSTTPERTGLAALRHACGVVARDGEPSVGRLFITGEDSLDLLNRLTTNKLEELPVGQGTTTVMTNADGRVVDLLALGALDDGIWCLTSPGYAQTVIGWLDMFTFAEEITVEDRTSDTFHLILSGPTASSVIAACAHDPDLATVALYTIAHAEIADATVVVWRRLAGGADGFEILGDLTDREAILAALVQAGAQLTSPDAWETHRVLNGMPAMDAEFGLFNNPLEARLLGSISGTKGCYTGQEVLARLQTYNKVQRRLMAIDLDAPVAPGTKLVSEDGKNAGQITSVTETPDGIKGLALVATKLALDRAVLATDLQGATATLREPAYALATEPNDA
jgi:folate-binding protein YgfZ